MKEIILSDGKYTFSKVEHTLLCYRYGEERRDFVEDNAVHCLFDRCIELQEEVDRLTKLVHHYAKQLS